ncbi:hypothetical protein BDV3_000165 [Batrachochytrium dendrobatidis]
MAIIYIIGAFLLTLSHCKGQAIGLPPTRTAPVESTLATSSGSTESRQSNSLLPAATSLACNPFIQVCPDADCQLNVQGHAYISIHSPKSDEYHYSGTPILVNWTYSADTDRSLFPVNSVDIYYKLENDRSNKWTLWKSVAPSNTSFEDVIPNAPAQSYSLRVVCDNIDITGITGHAASCHHVGFPRMAVKSFRLLTTRNVQVSNGPSQFQPNTSNSTQQTRFSSIHVLITAVVLLFSIIAYS